MNQDVVFMNGLIAFAAAFVIATILSKVLIPILAKLKLGQNIQEDGPQNHLVKAGTPSMGGVIFLTTFVLVSTAFFNTSLELKMVVFTTFAFGLVGFIDDYIKVKKKRNMGLTEKQKWILQIAVTIPFFIAVYKLVPNYSVLDIPFSDKTLDLGIFYLPFFLVFVLATVNAVNLTDGLDGLATGVVMLIVVFFGFIALAINDPMFYIASIMVGSLAGFLIFNYYPAAVFMGDTGSLALGGFLSCVAVILKMELFIPIVGIMLVISVLSSFLQKFWYKYTRKKTGEPKRLFKMAPYHHHLEQCGWSETKIVMFYYLVTALACLIGYIAY